LWQSEIVYVFWLINPAFHHKGIHIHTWTHLTAFVGVGGSVDIPVLALLEATAIVTVDHQQY
jgi:hypothetical protein